MKRATFTIGLALAAAYASSAGATVDYVGSDTIKEVMIQIEDECEELPAYDLESDGDLEINYTGTGSGNGESALERDTGERSGTGARHQLGGMSRPFDGPATPPNACGQDPVTRTDFAVSGASAANQWPVVRPAQIVIGRDSIMNMAPSTIWNIADGSGDGDGTPDVWGAKIRLLYFGIDDALYTSGASVVAAPIADCSSAARASLASSLGLYHIYRRDDASGTTNEWKLFAGANANQPFCNAPGVATQNNDASLGDKGDKDPIRIACTNGEDVCGCDGTLGLLLPILVPTIPVADLYPSAICTGGAGLVFTQVDTAGNNITGNERNGRYTDSLGNRCTGGQARMGASGCIYWQNSGDARCIYANVDQAFDMGLMGPLVTASGSLCPNAATTHDIRVYNLDVRNSAGRLYDGVSAIDFEGRGFYRIHMVKGSTNTNGGIDCQETDATLQIGCLVKRDAEAGKTSLGMAGLQALQTSTNTYAMPINGVDSPKVIESCIGDPCTTNADCDNGAVGANECNGVGASCVSGVCQAGNYAFGRKLYVNVMSYYDLTDTFRINPAVAEPGSLPTDASGVQDNVYAGGDEASLLSCILNELDTVVNDAIVDNGYLSRLSTDPIIEPLCPVP